MVSSQQHPGYVAYLHYADECLPKPSLETVQYLSKLINCTSTKGHWQNEVPLGERTEVTVPVSAAHYDIDDQPRVYRQRVTNRVIQLHTSMHS